MYVLTYVGFFLHSEMLYLKLALIRNVVSKTDLGSGILENHVKYFIWAVLSLPGTKETR